MNLFLHGIGSNENGKSPIRVADSLRSHPGEYFDMVLTNPPFGRKSSVTFVNEEGREEREASIVEDLQAALEQFTAIADDLGNGTVGGGKSDM